MFPTVEAIVRRSQERTTFIWIVFILIGSSICECARVATIQAVHAQENQEIAKTNETYRQCRYENKPNACRDLWIHRIDVCGRAGAVDLALAGDARRPDLPPSARCDTDRGELFWSRYPTAAQCRDGEVAACAEVWHLAFDESGGWAFPTNLYLSAAYFTVKCGSPIYDRYWPCLEAKMTTRKMLVTELASACTRPDTTLSVRTKAQAVSRVVSQ